MNDLRGHSSLQRPRRSQLVDIHGWVLMGNHYHLLLSERADKGISQFLMKLNVGYAKYFNEKYKRTGTLFQGRTKKILINSDAHFLHILHYIHLNPLDFLRETAMWRDGKIHGADSGLKQLESYRWSSYLDYCGDKNFPSIITKDLFGDMYGNYRTTIRRHLREIDLESIKGLTLE